LPGRGGQAEQQHRQCVYGSECRPGRRVVPVARREFDQHIEREAAGELQLEMREEIQEPGVPAEESGQREEHAEERGVLDKPVQAGEQGADSGIHADGRSPEWRSSASTVGARPRKRR